MVKKISKSERLKNSLKTKEFNSQKLISQAGETIADFARHHNGICVLGILDDIVIARAINELPDDFIEVQRLTHNQCINGLTNKQWNTLGDRLYSQLYNEDPKK